MIRRNLKTLAVSSEETLQISSIWSGQPQQKSAPKAAETLAARSLSHTQSGDLGEASWRGFTESCETEEFALQHIRGRKTKEHSPFKLLR